MHKVYALIHPLTNEPFYVGATTTELKYRLSEHISAAKKCLKSDGSLYQEKADLIKSMLAIGRKPEIRLLSTEISENVNRAERDAFLRLSSEGFKLLQSDGRFSSLKGEYLLPKMKKIVNFSAPKPIKDQIYKLAKENNISVSKMSEILVREGLHIHANINTQRSEILHQV